MRQFSVLLILFLCVGVRAQQSQGTLRGQVTDELGGVVVGATVTATDAAGVERSATTNDEGLYAFSALPPGRYTIRVIQAGFAPFENAAVEVAAGRTEPLNIVLSVALEQEEVTVTAEEPIGTDPESNVGAAKGRELSDSSLKLKNACPRRRSVPGLVKISTRP